jgi:hypothetical protein
VPCRPRSPDARAAIPREGTWRRATRRGAGLPSSVAAVCSRNAARATR